MRARRQLGASLARVGEPRVGDHIRRRAGRAGRQRQPGDAGTAIEPRLPDERTIGLEDRVDDQHAGVVLRPVDGRRARVEEPAHVLGDAAGDDHRIERLRQQPAHLGQRLGRLTTRVAVGVEPCVHDGHRGLRREELEHLAVPHREACLADEGEDGDERIAMEDRQGDEALEAGGLPPPAPRDARVLQRIGHPGGLAALGHPADDALAVGHDPDGVARARRLPADLVKRQRARGLVGDPEADVRGADQIGGLAADGFEHGVGPETRRDEPAEPGERPKIRRGGAGPTGNTHRSKIPDKPAGHRQRW